MVIFSEYKGKPTISLKKNEDDKYSFTFGLTKARLILDNLEKVKQFVEEHKRKLK